RGIDAEAKQDFGYRAHGSVGVEFHFSSLEVFHAEIISPETSEDESADLIGLFVERGRGGIAPALDGFQVREQLRDRRFPDFLFRAMIFAAHGVEPMGEVTKA